jgi:hypothetical protein
MNSKGMPPRTSERLISGSIPFQKPYSGATAILVDEFDARQLKCPPEHNDRLRPHILSFFRAYWQLCRGILAGQPTVWLLRISRQRPY